MMYPDSMRASDDDRQRVVDALQQQAGEGRLTLAEFDERSAAAYAATTLGDLRKLTKDLPVNTLPLGTSPNMPFGGMPNGVLPNGGLPWRPARGETQPSAGRALRTAATVLLVMFVASVALSFVAHFFFFPLPFILLGFVLFRMGRGGPHQGPGYHHH